MSNSAHMRLWVMLSPAWVSGLVCFFVFAATLLPARGASAQELDCEKILADGPYLLDEEKQNEYIVCRYRNGGDVNGGNGSSGVQPLMKQPPLMEPSATPLFENSSPEY